MPSWESPKISVSPGMERAKIWHMKGLLQIQDEKTQAIQS